jgi:hypothetical protein
MSSLFRDYVASVRPRGEPFRSRSIGGNARRQGLKTTFALLCPRSPGLTPRSLFGYSIVDSLISFCVWHSLEKPGEYIGL